MHCIKVLQCKFLKTFKSILKPKTNVSVIFDEAKREKTFHNNKQMFRLNVNNKFKRNGHEQYL